MLLYFVRYPNDRQFSVMEKQGAAACCIHKNSSLLRDLYPLHTNALLSSCLAWQKPEDVFSSGLLLFSFTASYFFKVTFTVLYTGLALAAAPLNFNSNFRLQLFPFVKLLVSFRKISPSPVFLLYS